MPCAKQWSYCLKSYQAPKLFYKGFFCFHILDYIYVRLSKNILTGSHVLKWTLNIFFKIEFYLLKIILFFFSDSSGRADVYFYTNIQTLFPLKFALPKFSPTIITKNSTHTEWFRKMTHDKEKSSCSKGYVAER